MTAVIRQKVVTLLKQVIDLFEFDAILDSCTDRDAARYAVRFYQKHTRWPEWFECFEGGRQFERDKSKPS